MPDLFELSNMEFDEVSLVPAGDNVLAKVVLSKADASATKTGTKSGSEDGWEGREHKFHDDGTGKCKLCDQERSFEAHEVRKCPPDCPMCSGEGDDMSKDEKVSILRKFLSVISKSGGKEDGSDIVGLGKGDPPRREGNVGEKSLEDILKNLPDEVRDDVAEALQERDERIEELEEAVQKIDEDDDEVIEDEDDDEEAQVKKLLSKADPAVRSLIEKMQKNEQEALRIAKEERENRLNKEMLEKAAGYKNIPGTPEEKAEILKQAYALSEEFGKKVEQQWKATNAQLDEAGSLLGTFGKDSPGDLTVSTEVEKRVTEIRKEHPDITKEQAEAMVYEQHPELYDKVVSGKEA